jgi:hypothetical protein
MLQLITNQLFAKILRGMFFIIYEVNFIIHYPLKKFIQLCVLQQNNRFSVLDFARFDHI